jgi:hypothetical protein
MQKQNPNQEKLHLQTLGGGLAAVHRGTKQCEIFHYLQAPTPPAIK